MFLTCRWRRSGTHARCRGPILHRGSTPPLSSAGSPPAGERPWRERRQAWSRSPARRRRSGPRSPPPRTRPSSAGGSGGTRPAHERRRSEHTSEASLFSHHSGKKKRHQKFHISYMDPPAEHKPPPGSVSNRFWLAQGHGVVLEACLCTTGEDRPVLPSKCAEKPAGLQRDRKLHSRNMFNM